MDVRAPIGVHPPPPSSLRILLLSKRNLRLVKNKKGEGWYVDFGTPPVERWYLEGFFYIFQGGGMENRVFSRTRNRRGLYKVQWWLHLVLERLVWAHICVFTTITTFSPLLFFFFLSSSLKGGELADETFPPPSWLACRSILWENSNHSARPLSTRIFFSLKSRIAFYDGIGNEEKECCFVSHSAKHRAALLMTFF